MPFSCDKHQSLLRLNLAQHAPAPAFAEPSVDDATDDEGELERPLADFLLLVSSGAFLLDALSAAAGLPPGFSSPKSGGFGDEPLPFREGFSRALPAPASAPATGTDLTLGHISTV
jgi:hypothetical protein